MKKSIITSITILTLTCILGCNPKPYVGINSDLASFIQATGFQPFSVPNDAMGPMSLVTFKNGSETIVGLQTECFPNISGIKSANLAVANWSRTATSSNELSASLAKALVDGLDLSFLFNDVRVKTVKMSLKNPTMQFVTEITARSQVNSSSAACKNAAVEKKNVLIHAVLAADGILIELEGTGNQRVTLNADYANVGKLSANHKKDLTDKGSLVINDKRLYYGYRPFDATKSSGLEQDLVSLIPLEGSAAMKRASTARTAAMLQ